MNKVKTSKKNVNLEISIFQRSILDSLLQFNPLSMIRNPIIFLVEVCFFITLILSFYPDLFGDSTLSKSQNLIIAFLLFLTIFFGNLAENLAKYIGRIKADSFRIVHGDVEVKKINSDQSISYVFASELKKGDLIRVKEGDLIPLDGEVVSGIASVDESAITGESSPVLKEAGTDTASTVTGGTRILTDSLVIKITAEQGETYLDQMVTIAEGTERHKSENELSLSVLLTSSTISCLFAVVTLAIIMLSLKLKIEYSFFLTLLICLIPTTIGGLIVPISIAGFERINALNVIPMTKKSVDIAGDINYLFLDKTGTITYENRMALEFFPVNNHSIIDISKAAYISSVNDDTPEGKSILSLAKRYGVDYSLEDIHGINHEFTAHTRMSGIDLENGDMYRKGAVDAIELFIQKMNGSLNDNVNKIVSSIALEGGTPLLVAKNAEVIGVINLKDMIKPSVKGKFTELKKLGVITVMCTGDNDLTAKVIAQEAGIDQYISQAKPEDKIKLIRDYQLDGKVIAMIGDGTNDAPALAQADIGLAMNHGTTAAKEASNMIDLDSDPTKIIDIIKVGRQLHITRGSISTFSIINDITKYFVIIPSILPIEGIQKLNFLHLTPGFSAVVSALIFNTIILPIMTPIALKGVSIKDPSVNKLLNFNLIVFGIGGIVVPLVAMKLISMIVGGLL